MFGPVPHVGGGLAGQAAQHEQQQLVVVALVGQIPAQIVQNKSLAILETNPDRPAEVPLHVLHDRVLLGVDEGLKHHPHRHVHVVLRDELPENKINLDPELKEILGTNLRCILAWDSAIRIMLSM